MVDKTVRLKPEFQDFSHPACPKPRNRAVSYGLLSCLEAESNRKRTWERERWLYFSLQDFSHQSFSPKHLFLSTPISIFSVNPTYPLSHPLSSPPSQPPPNPYSYPYPPTISISRKRPRSQFPSTSSLFLLKLMSLRILLLPWVPESWRVPILCWVSTPGTLRFRKLTLSRAVLPPRIAPPMDFLSSPLSAAPMSANPRFSTRLFAESASPLPPRNLVC